MLIVLLRRARATARRSLVLPSRVSCVLLFAAWAGAPARGERVIYVHATAGGKNNGASWTDAYADLQDALDDAKSNGGCPCEIWVAAGIYNPDRGTGDQTLAFELANNIGVYGGFAGWEECRDRRDWIVNETILSGDLNGDDDPQLVPVASCCTQNYVCEDEECRAIVVAVDPGCATVWRPHCADYAIALCCETCRPTRCDNTYNVVRAFYTDYTPILDGLTIEGGEAISEQIEAGAGLDIQSSNLTVSRCTFRRNNAWHGAGVWTHGGEPKITDSVFSENGGTFTWPSALWAQDQASIANCTFRDNHGGGIWDWNGAKIENCRFLRNDGTGLLLSAWVSDDVIGCTFAGNTYSGLSAGGYVRVINCNFFGNSHKNSGGGMRGGYGGATLINCVFAGNRAGTESNPGGAGAFHGSGFGVDRFTNCTIVNNYARGVGGISTSAPFLKNCLLWGNRNDYGSIEFSQIAGSPGDLQVNYSIIQGWTGSLGGVGNSGADPLLVDAYGPDGIAGTEDDNLRFSPGSPAINAGDPNVSGLPTTDLDGHGRVLCGRVDIGAYEFGIGDFNCDYRVNILDSVQFPACLTGPNAAELGIANSEERMTLLQYRMASPSPRPSSLEGEGVTGCEVFDFDADGDVDLADFAAFSRALQRIETFNGVNPRAQP